MTVPYRSTKAPWVLAAVCFVVLAGCTPSPPVPVMTAPETPVEATSSPASTSTAPSSAPPSRTESPSPSSTLTEEQAAAAATVLEFFRLKNELGQNPALDVQPLADITMGQTQQIQMSTISEYQKENLVQTGETRYRVLDIGTVRSNEDKSTVSVVACTDASDVDVVNAGSRVSALPSDRQFFVEWNIALINADNTWKIDDILSDFVEGCRNA